MSGKSNSKKEEKINFVVGLGKSGFWAAKFLRSMGKKVIVWESKENKELLEKKEVLKKQGISVYLDKQFLFTIKEIYSEQLYLWDNCSILEDLFYQQIMKTSNW